MSKRKIFVGLLISAAIATVAMLLLSNRSLQVPSVDYAYKVKSEMADSPVAKQQDAIAVTSYPDDKTPVLTSDDIEITDIYDEVTEKVSRRGMSLINNPVHPSRAKLQRQMSQESAEQTFLHLTDNENFKMLIPMMASCPFSPGCYASDIRIMAEMTRIRKLLADARNDPEHMSVFMQEQLSAIAETFPAAHEEFMQMLKESNSGNRLILKELPEMQKQRLLSTVAVYILSEIAAQDSLPLLARLSKLGKPHRSANFAGSYQVNPTFILHSMHRLVTQFPEAGLSARASQARVDYLAMAEKAQIANPQTTTVAAWDATYHEDDFRTTLLGKQLYVSQSQPTIELAVFPSRGKLSRLRIEALLDKMRTFIEEISPQ